MNWRALRNLVWRSPERRWWGSLVLAFFGAFLALRFSREQRWFLVVLTIVLAVVIEAVGYHVLVRPKRPTLPPN